MKNVVFRSEFKAPSRVLNWFPGHMRKAMRNLETEVAKASVFMEVRDARIPRTSHNAELAALLPPKVNRLVLYNKIDLANEKKSLEIIKKIHEDDPTPWMHISTKKNVNINKLTQFI
jgi:ribosome biogenesis GTPase A